MRLTLPLFLHFLASLLFLQLSAPNLPALEKSAEDGASSAAPGGKPFRAVWIASVFNLNFPSKQRMSKPQQQAELSKMLDIAKQSGCNAVLLQVRPESDALYKSSLDPASRWVTGTQGLGPGYDIMGFAIEECRKRGLEFHAWLNPFRADASTTPQKLAANHVGKKFPQYLHRYEKIRVMDPGSPAVQDHIVLVVADILLRYKVDGIHFDDYFYPYPKDPRNVKPFPDNKTYEQYVRLGGKLMLEDWRRHNVNLIVERVYRTIKDQRPEVAFGISPFGIAEPGIPKGTEAGLDYFNMCYADPVTWLRNGTIDYLAPQLYWPDKGPQSFTKLLEWWRDPRVNPRNIPIYPGIALDRLGGSHKWPQSEVMNQLKIERSIKPSGGMIFFNIGQLMSNLKGIRTALQEDFAAQDATQTTLVVPR